MGEATCGHFPSDPILLILSEGRLVTFCDLDCVVQWVAQEQQEVLKDIEHDNSTS